MNNKEIERKFLVKTSDIRNVISKVHGSRIHQGYLGNEPVVRVRTIDDGAKERGFLTVKGAGFITRSEFEYEIPFADAWSMLLMSHSVVFKTRYKVKHAGHTWEVDEFLGNNAGLWLAEIELQHEDEVFDMPPWLNGEVSTNPKFTNVELSKNVETPWI